MTDGVYDRYVRDQQRRLAEENLRLKAERDRLETDLGETRRRLDNLRRQVHEFANERDRARATSQRLNHRAQQAESRFVQVRRAVREWQINDRGTYVPLRSLAAIAKAVGREIPDDRFELHYQRVERLEADLAIAEEHIDRGNEETSRAYAQLRSALTRTAEARP